MNKVKIIDHKKEKKLRTKFKRRNSRIIKTNERITHC